MSGLYFLNEVNLNNWTLAYARQNSDQANINHVKMKKQQDSILKLEFDQSELNNKLNEPIYWSAPSSYTGNKVTSYGGTISYKLRIAESGSNSDLASQIRADLILVGQDMSLIHTSIRQPSLSTNDDDVFENTVDILESKFSHLLTGNYYKHNL
jgi:hypothetical protein